MILARLMLLLIFCLKAFPCLGCSYVEVSFREQIRNAKLAVLGVVVGVRGEVGSRIAAFKVEDVLKGSTPLSEIDLPFKETAIGPCDGTISYNLRDRYLLLFDERDGNLSRYPVRFTPTDDLTTANVKRFLSILKTQDKRELSDLYRAIFESGERQFLMEAYAALQRLSPDETDRYDRVLTGALAKSMGSDRKDIYLIDALVDLRSKKAASVLVKMATGTGQTWPREKAIDALARLHVPGAESILIEIAARDPSSSIRRAAQGSLPRLGDADGTEFLVNSYASERSSSNRARLLDQLAETRNSQVSEFALAALESKSAEERRAAYRAVGILKEKRALNILTSRLLTVSVDESERQEIIDALIELDGSASVPFLTAHMPKETGWRRSRDISLLGKTKSASARKILQQSIQDNISKHAADEDFEADWELKSGLDAILSLGGEEDIAMGLSLAESPDSRVRSKAIAALGDARVSPAFDILAEGLSDPDTGSETADALLKIDYQKGLPLVLTLVQKGNAEVLAGSLEMIEKKLDMEAIKVIERAAEMLRPDDITRLRAEGVVKRVRYGMY